jgi:hypothetical protein
MRDVSKTVKKSIANEDASKISMESKSCNSGTTRKREKSFLSFRGAFNPYVPDELF